MSNPGYDTSYEGTTVPLSGQILIFFELFPFQLPIMQRRMCLIDPDDLHPRSDPQCHLVHMRPFSCLQITQYVLRERCCWRRFDWLHLSVVENRCLSLENGVDACCCNTDACLTPYKVDRLAHEPRGFDPWPHTSRKPSLNLKSKQFYSIRFQKPGRPLLCYVGLYAKKAGVNVGAEVRRG